MNRSRLALVVAVLAVASVPRPSAAQIPADYGVVELGEVRTGCFSICFGQDCSASARVNSVTVAAPFFVRGLRLGPAANPCDPFVTTPTTLPVTVPVNQRLVFDVDLVPTQVGFFDAIVAIDGTAIFALSADVDPVTFCLPSASAYCLANDRFKTRIFWRTEFATRGSGGTVAGSSDNSGNFYFFNSNNWEMLVKVLNACTPSTGNRFWVFAAATTNVEFTLTVTDTETQQVKTYFNPLGNPAQPIQDTSAFATCP